MSSARVKFIEIPELLSHLGRFVTNRRLLYDLCLVSKTFNAVFLPFLYEELYFRVGNSHILTEKLDVLLEIKSLKYVRTLDFSIRANAVEVPERSEGEECQLYNETIQSLLPKLEGLTTFRWADQPLFETTASVLQQKCPKLEHLSISYPSDIEEILGIAFEEDYGREDGLAELRPFLATQDISSFSNLKSLHLHEMYGDINNKKAEIVDILLQSPTISSLSLSFNTNTIDRLHREDQDDYIAFLESFVEKYKEMGGEPLHLSRLALGYGVVLWEDDEEQAPAGCLADLTDLECLEDVHLSNQSGDTALYFEDPDGIAWWTFTPSVCPNLRCFGFHHISDTVQNWRRYLEPGYLTQLRIENSYGYDVTELGNLLEAKGTYLSFLAITEVDASAEYGDFSVFNFPTLQAISVSLWPISDDIKESFLDWIEEMASLEQLNFRETDPHPERDDNFYEDLAHEVALKGKNLKYLKLEDTAWRIWHESDDYGRESCRLEVLDRFEQRAIEAFQIGSER